MLPVLLIGYLFLLIFRPYEYWPILGTLRIERVYMLSFMAIVFFSKQKRFIFHKINGMVVFFCSVLIISGVFAYSLESAQKLIEDYLKYIVFYVMVILTVRDEDDFRLVIKGFLAVMCLYVWKSAWEFFVHGRYQWTMGIRRMTGIDLTYGDPNAFAASICYSLPLLWGMIRYQFEDKWVRWALWGYGLLATVAIIYTGSRSGMATGLLFFLLVLASTQRKFLAFLLIGIMLVVSWDFMPESLQTRFRSTVVKGEAPASADESAEGRMQGFLQGIDTVKKYPVLGIGPANFKHSWPGIENGYNAHNLYGQLMGELGSLGVLSFGGLLIVMFWTNRKVVLRARNILKNNVPLIIKPSLRLPADDAGKRWQKSSSSPPIPKEKFERNVFFLMLVAQAIIHTLILMMFKGWADHNLYRYTWLWLAALTVLTSHFFEQGVGRHVQA